MENDEIEVSDQPLAAGQMWCVQTTAWWTAHLATSPEMRPQAYLAEQVLTEWVPQDPAREWMWDRRMTGERVWLSGSQDEAHALGIDTTPRWPTGRWRAPFGDYFAAEHGRSPAPRQGRWSRPAHEFLDALPRDHDALRSDLIADSAGLPRGPSGPFANARRALRCGRVPADLRSSLVAVLRSLPEVQVSTMVGEQDRPALVFAVDGEQWRLEMTVDAGTGQFVGDRDITRSDRPAWDLPAGTTLATTSVRSAAAPAIGCTPSAWR